MMAWRLEAAPAAATLRAAMDACLLAFDTSADSLVISLSSAAGHFGRVEPGGARASQRILPAARELLDLAGLEFRHLEAIAFARGPGAFTGLRTACAVAQGLAFGLDRPVLALDSLLRVAEDADAAPDWGYRQGMPLWVAIDARMDEVYAGCWVRLGEGWRSLRPSALYTLPALAAEWSAAPPAAVAGNAVSVFGPRLPDVACRFGGPHDPAAALGRLALDAWQRGAALPPDAALPLYLRDKVALTIEERRGAGHVA